MALLMFLGQFAIRPMAANYILAYLLCALAMNSALAQSGPRVFTPGCDAWLLTDVGRTLNQLQRKGFQIEIEPDRVTIEHRSRYQHAWARMLDKDLMVLGLYTRGPRGGRIPGFEGHILFKLFLDYFGPRVKSVLGDWENNSDNLNRFNELSREHDLTEAASLTWTGRQAALYGFTEVKILDARGERGAYSDVVVEFRKPRR